MDIQIWINLDHLDDLIKAAGDSFIEMHEIPYTRSQVNEDQICVNVSPDLFIGLQDRDILVADSKQSV
jgi:hypothetical protein